MIKYFVKLMMVVAAAVCVASCTQEIDPIDGAEVIILPDVQNRQVVLLSDIEDTVINVQTTGWCNATVSYPADYSAADEWLSMDPADGSGRGTYGLSFVFGANINTAARIATVTIVSETDPNITTSFDIKQLGTEPFIVPSVQALTLSKVAGPSSLTVSTNKACSLSIEYKSGGEGWVTVSPERVEKGDNIPITLQTLSNETGDKREATLVFSDIDDPEFKVSVNLTQVSTFVETAFATKVNNEKLECSWIGDASVVSYTVIVIEPGNSSNEILKVEGIATDVAKIDLLSYNEIKNINSPIEVQIIGITADPDVTAPSINNWITHSRFGDGSADGSSEAKCVNISSARHLANIAVTENALGWYYKQTANINFKEWLENNNFAPVGTDTDPFTGVYDGGNFTISNWKYSSLVKTNGSSGIFCSLKGADATVKNLNISNASLTLATDGSSGYADADVGHAFVVGYNEGGTVSEVRIIGSNLLCSSPRALIGGIVGVNNGGTVSHCTVENSVVSQTNGGNSSNLTTSVGGIVGVNWPDSEIEYCVISNSSVNNRAMGQAQGEAWCGGIAGASDGLVFQCYNDFTQVGRTDDSGTNCQVGGIVGGSITPRNQVQKWTGGRYPDLDSYRTKTGIIRQCGNTGNVVRAATVNMGGIVGYLGDNGIGSVLPDQLIVEECYNKGNVYTTAANGTVYIGGIVGRGEWITVRNCINGYNMVVTPEDPVNSGSMLYPRNRQSAAAGGILGYTSHPFIVENCAEVRPNTNAVTPVRTILSDPYSASATYEHHASVLVGWIADGGNVADSKISSSFGDVTAAGAAFQGNKEVGGYSLWVENGALYSVGKDNTSKVTVDGSSLEVSGNLTGIGPYTGWDGSVWTFAAGKFPELTNLTQYERPADAVNFPQ